MRKEGKGREALSCYIDRRLNLPSQGLARTSYISMWVQGTCYCQHIDRSIVGETTSHASASNASSQNATSSRHESPILLVHPSCRFHHLQGHDEDSSP